jgi:hypothetical protein
MRRRHPAVARGEGTAARGHLLRTVKILDDRFANPAYGLLLVTGLTMVWVGDVDLTQFWLATALVLYALLVVLGLSVYSPALRAQIRAYKDAGPMSERVQARIHSRKGGRRDPGSRWACRMIRSGACSASCRDRSHPARAPKRTLTPFPR